MAVRSVKLAEGIMMPLISFGTYRIGGEKLVNVMDVALRTGYRAFDTAQSYENEADMGKALAELLPKHNLKREDIFLTTKILPENAAAVPSLVKESLTNLGVSQLDLLLLQYPMCVSSSTAGLLADNNEMWSAMSVVNTKADNKEWRISVWGALEQCFKSGEVRALGVSNYESRHLELMSVYASVFPAVNQIEFHPHLQRPEIQRTCEAMEMRLQAYAPLGRQQPALLSAPPLNKIAGAHGASVAQVLLAWAMQLGVGVVPRSNNEMRIQSNFESCALHLSDQEMRMIRELDEGTAYTASAPWKVK